MMPDWFKHLRGRSKQRSAAHAGAGQRIYAVGDVHGCLAPLRALKGMIAADNAGRAASHVALVYVGDYIDRGPDSRGVLNEVLLPIVGIDTMVHLKGNHEAMLMQFVSDPLRAVDWLGNGGVETLASFGVDGQMARRGFDLEITRDALIVALGPERLHWLHSLPLQIQIGDYYLCHAGIRPGVALGAQRALDLLWIREPFLTSTKDHGAMIVHGHTPGFAPEVRSNRINLDTACFATGRLTAAVLDEGSAVTFLTTAGGISG